MLPDLTKLTASRSPVRCTSDWTTKGGWNYIHVKILAGLEVTCIQRHSNLCYYLQTSKKISHDELFYYVIASFKSNLQIFILAMLNKLRCHTHIWLTAHHIAWFRLLIQVHILSDKQCRSRADGFWRSQMIWFYTVCKGRAYPGSTRWELILTNLF